MNWLRPEVVGVVEIPKTPVDAVEAAVESREVDRRIHLRPLLIGNKGLLRCKLELSNKKKRSDDSGNGMPLLSLPCNRLLRFLQPLRCQLSNMLLVTAWSLYMRGSESKRLQYFWEALMFLRLSSG